MQVPILLTDLTERVACRHRAAGVRIKAFLNIKWLDLTETYRNENVHSRINNFILKEETLGTIFSVT